MSIQFTMRMMKKISLNFGMTLVPCLVCLILFSQGVTVSAVHAAETRVELTDREKAWLEDHPTISIGNEMDWPPFSFVEEDQPVGFSTDYLKLVATKTGMNIKWVTGYTWKELLKMAENGKIDALHSLSKTEEREKYLGFTPPFYTSSKVIFTRPEDASIQGLEDISDKKIAIIDGFSYENYLKKEFPRMEQIKAANALEGLIAVSMGKADAYIDRQAVCLYFIQKFNVSNVVFATIFKSDNSANDSLFIGTHKNRPELLTIIKKGMNAISDEEINALKNKWFGTTIESKINLTADEKEWIEEHRDIRLGVTSAWPPIEYFQGGAYSGLSAEYVKQLAKDTGLSFAPPPFFDWPDLLPLAQEKELDVLPGVSRTPDREKYLSFSRSYGKFPIVVYQRTDSHPVKSMGELDGKSVAVVSNCIIEKFLRDNHPSIKLQSYTNLKKALLVLSRGKVDALAGNAVAVEYIKQKESLFNVAPAIKTPYVQDLRFGIRNDWEPLVKIIDKWLNQLDETTKDRLTREAGVDLDIPVVAKETKRSVDFTQLLLIGGGIIVVFGISFIILLFIRRFVVSRAETLYSSHQYKIVGIVVGVMFLCLVVVATWYALAQVEKDARYAVGESLESVLLTTHDALSIWSDQNKIYIKELAAMPFMRGLTEALLSLPEDKAVIEASPQLWNIRKLMVKAQESRKIIGFAIISKNYLNYASKHDSNILDKNIISIQRPRLMDKVFLGDTIFIPPVQAEGTDLGDSYEEVMTGVAFATPIKASDGKVIAILAIYYDVDENYQRIISLGRIGGTGETYTFDKNGILTSESRFDDLLKELGLIEKDQRGLLNLHLFDPGGNLLKGHILNTEERLPLT